MCDFSAQIKSALAIVHINICKDFPANLFMSQLHKLQLVFYLIFYVLIDN